MKKIILIASLLLFSIDFVADEKAVFTNHDNSLVLQGQNEFGAHVFTGSVTLEGEIHFIFDMASGEKATDIMFAKFLPTEEAIKSLQNVISGKRIGDTNKILLEPAQKALDTVYGEIKAKTLMKGNKK